MRLRTRLNRFLARGIGVACLLTGMGATAIGQTPVPVDSGDPNEGKAPTTTESPAQVARRLAWWSEARFGMFIHWGLYAQDGCFWKGQDGKTEHMMRHLQIPVAEYAKIAQEFNPVRFDALQWVRVAKAAGMKYMIITAKHHDGFAMFESPCNDYNITARTPFRRDPIRELAEACRKEGLRLGVYYSLGRDWHDPDVPTRDGYRSNTWDYPDEATKDFSKYFERKVKPQVRELLTRYGPIAVMWFDTPEKVSPSQSQELVAMIHRLQPECIVNSRVGNRLGDYGVQEQKIPDQTDPKPWETCMTLNGHWGYHKMDNNWKSAEALVRNLVDVASKGGNFLLNVGPTGRGLIPAPSVARLGEVGDWMRVNGEAIYGTTASPLEKVPWGRCTRKSTAGRTTLYLHIFDWPANGKLVVPRVRNSVAAARLLATATRIAAANGPEGLVLVLPATAPDKISSTVALEIEGSLKIE